MFLLIAASAFAAPVPLFQDSWFSSYLDIPRTGLKPEAMTRMVVELTVNTRGETDGCRANVIAGNPNMGPYTCARLKDRALFRPARNHEGRKVYGVYRMVVGWWIGKGPPPKTESHADFQFPIAAWPAAGPAPDTTSRVVNVEFAVDPAGRVTGCGAYEYKAPNSKELDEDPRINPVLVPIACERVMRLPAVEPAKDRGGKAVESVQTAAVRLELLKD